VGSSILHGCIVWPRRERSSSSVQKVTLFLSASILGLSIKRQACGDQTVRLTGVKTPDDYPQYLRYVVFYDEKTDKRLGFFTNNFELPALVIAQLYKCRWQVELFFKWIKQHLRIKAFFGTNESAVKTQIWIAISVYVLVAIAKKGLGVEASLYTILQILSLTLLDKIPLVQLPNDTAPDNFDGENPTQLNLFS
jgi:hypothetical protein